MHRFIPHFANQPVSRYTSYPSAAQFHEGVGAADQAAALTGIADAAPVSLYVHIPYCHAICWYCGCNTGAVGRIDRLAAYTAALALEIDAVAARLRGRVVSIHFGGGSPNVLAPQDFIALANLLRARFDCAPSLEIAVELDPRSLDRSYADALAVAGVTRVSLGAQTFAAHVQTKINRTQPYAQVAKATADLRAAGIASVNLDLMYGLPGQSVDDLNQTLAAAIALSPDRIAMFGYAHMPRLLKRQRMIEDATLPDAPERFAQSVLAHDVLVATGYRAIGFDHFARAGDSLALAWAQGRLRRNFQGFTDEPGEAIIGLGASAISQYDGLLVQNDKHVGRYRTRVANTGLAGSRGVVRSAQDQLRGAIIERLLCDGTVDVAALVQRHRQCLGGVQDAMRALRELATYGLVHIDGWRITIPGETRPYARLAAGAFDEYRAVPNQGLSKAV